MSLASAPFDFTFGITAAAKDSSTYKIREDAYTPTAWIAAYGADLAIDPTCLAIAGDSAGGTLATVVCQNAKGFGFKITLQVLLCSLIDIDAGGVSLRSSRHPIVVL